MNKIRILYTPWQWQNCAPSLWQEATVVVVDQLRATSTIVTAMAHGAKAIYAVSSMEQARALSTLLPQALLAGERGGKPPEGFALGNSPREFSPRSCQDREIILTTTNGTRALMAASQARQTIPASLLNLGAVSQFLEQHHDALKPLILVAAGTAHEFSWEDAFVLSALLETLFPNHPLTSLARGQLGSSAALMHRTLNGRRLVRLGLGADIEFSAQIDAFPILPRCEFITLGTVPTTKITLAS